MRAASTQVKAAAEGGRVPQANSCEDLRPKQVPHPPNRRRKPAAGFKGGCSDHRRSGSPHKSSQADPDPIQPIKPVNPISSSSTLVLGEAPEVLRAEDLVSFYLNFVNLKLDTSNIRDPKLVVDDATKPAYLVVWFAPQAILEEAYFETAAITQNNSFNPPVPVTPTTGDILPAPGTVPAYIAGARASSSRFPNPLSPSPTLSRACSTGRILYSTSLPLPWVRLFLRRSPRHLP